MLFTFACIYVLARAILAPLPGLILRTFVPWIPHFLISFAVFISVIHVWIGFRGRRWRPLFVSLLHCTAERSCTHGQSL
ncbi:hypothetical protein BOTBODRAFT_444357 [Botryobasidium botryosum FD-172 SS1]|uniref:Ferric oxidoreductase domain-containing protein n=1 Tax=Botryobasidium botryosum (strain FD-172 SS1) TaxID=930990 RepID=A0A067MVH9_BOTB1|nr:hypothetical protein BOTBODRAFT_444357 [Botryobasidium botryosum FD-172 SS1]